jgi:hypothetical protein
MLKLRTMVILLALGAVSCGTDRPADPAQSFIILKEDALKVTRLSMRTAALVGRHAVIPNGATLDLEKQPVCPLTKELKISIKPTACIPGFDGPNVDCAFVETYGCEEVSGVITNDISMRADSLSFALATTNYVEGNETYGYVKYVGGITATTSLEGTRYYEALNIVARPLGESDETVLDAVSDIFVKLVEGRLVFTGTTTMDIVGRGPARLELIDVDFGTAGECASSPVAGTIRMTLVGLESADLVITGCGEGKLVHIENEVVINEVAFSAAELAGGFAAAISDTAGFRGVAFNLTPAAADLYPARWCVPYRANSGVKLLAESRGFDPATLPTGKPISECLTFAAPTTTSPATASLSIAVDESGLGLFLDDEQITVHFLSGGFVFVDDDNATFDIRWIKNFSAQTPVLRSELDENAFTPFCDPSASHTCPSTEVGYRIDHFGLGMLDVSTLVPTGYYFIHMRP